MFDDQLSPQQLTVISALSSGATVTEAAAQAGIHRNTINNWRRNLQTFQHALDHAYYDRALHYREKLESEIETALKTLHEILADPNVSPSVRLRAALAVIQTATQQPEPKKQVMLYFEPLQPIEPAVHNSAQQPPQPIRRDQPKVGRNEACPCGSGQKYKRCCLNKPPQTEAAAAA